MSKFQIDKVMGKDYAIRSVHKSAVKVSDLILDNPNHSKYPLIEAITNEGKRQKVRLFPKEGMIYFPKLKDVVLTERANNIAYVSGNWLPHTEAQKFYLDPGVSHMINELVLLENQLKGFNPTEVYINHTVPGADSWYTSSTTADKTPINASGSFFTINLRRAARWLYYKFEIDSNTTFTINFSFNGRNGSISQNGIYWVKFNWRNNELGELKSLIVTTNYYVPAYSTKYVKIRILDKFMSNYAKDIKDLEV